MARDVVIFDLDGTLALVDHRRPFVKSGNWRAFFAACVDDPPNEPVVEALRLFWKEGYYIIIFSGRSDEVEDLTLNWLRDNSIPYDELHMRPEGDNRKDSDLKKEFLDTKVNKDTIFCVYDDRDQVVSMWRENNIPCFQVAPGNF